MAKVTKVRTRGFTQVDNRVIDNLQMHMKTLGLYTYMWRQPDDWCFYIDQIAAHFKDGKTAVRSAMDELIKLGLVERTRSRNSLGQLGAYEYILYDEPQPPKQETAKKEDAKKDEQKPKSENLTQAEPPKSGFPTLENPTSENRTLPILSTLRLSTPSDGGGGNNIDIKLQRLKQPTPEMADRFAQAAMGFDEELVSYALDQALAYQHHPSYSYVAAILERYRTAGYQTVTDAMADSIKFAQRHLPRDQQALPTPKIPEFKLAAEQLPY